MKYGDFCLEVGTNLASLQKFLRNLECPANVKPEIFEQSKVDAIEACARFEIDLLDEFGEYYDD